MFAVKASTRIVFEREKLLIRQQKKEEGTLLRLGGFYRTVVQRSMRNGNLKRGQVSAEPGQPPRYHTKALRQGIRFQYNRTKHTVYVFATKLNGTTMLSSIPTPYLLEHGGTARIRNYGYVYPSSPERVFSRKRAGRVRRQVGEKTIRMRPRPFVGGKSINWPIVVARLQADRSKLGI